MRVGRRAALARRTAPGLDAGMRYAVAVLLLGALVLLPGCNTAPDVGTSAQAAAAKLDEALRAAGMHTREGRFAEATTIYERELRRHPENSRVLAAYANMLHEQGQRESDAAARRDLLRRARKLAEKAENLGTDDPLTPMILSQVSADGRLVEPATNAFSSSPKVDELMRNGDAAFARRDGDAALAFYQKAYELEPTNYIATLYIGDVYFGKKEYAEAREWFGKAVALDPDRETGHRYLGDALMHLGRGPAALNEWIEALLCEPYARVTRQHFRPDMKAAAEKAGFVIPQFPSARSEIKDGKVVIGVEAQEGMLIMGYKLWAAAWREDDFAKMYPNETQRRRSLPEEVAAIEAMLDIADSTASDPDFAKDLKRWEGVLNGLRKLKQAGLLEAFVLLDRADGEIARDYPAYSEKNRDALRRYVRQYWCGLAETKR